MNTIEFGKNVSAVRKAQRLTQADMAMAAGTAIRFISYLENGKETCQIGKALNP